MPRFQNPTVLVTRPRDSSLRFLDALSGVAGPFVPLVAPAFETVATQDSVPQFDVAIFTSQVGARFAPDGNGRRAYCVGDTTAAAVHARGYDAVSAAGAVQDLINLILSHVPHGRLLHIRGENSVGDVSVHLRAEGLTCDDAVVYRKQRTPLAADMKEQINTSAGLILPLFSAETVSIIARWKVSFDAAQIIAISDAVAQASRGLEPAGITVSPTPDLRGMITETSALIA